MTRWTVIASAIHRHWKEKHVRLNLQEQQINKKTRSVKVDRLDWRTQHKSHELDEWQMKRKKKNQHHFSWQHLRKSTQLNVNIRHLRVLWSDFPFIQRDNISCYRLPEALLMTVSQKNDSSSVVCLSAMTVVKARSGFGERKVLLTPSKHVSTMNPPQSQLKSRVKSFSSYHPDPREVNWACSAF